MMCQILRKCFKLRSKGMHTPKIIWVGCITKAKEFVRIINRQCSGIARRQNKGMLKLNIVWA